MKVVNLIYTYSILYLDDVAVLGSIAALHRIVAAQDAAAGGSVQRLGRGRGHRQCRHRRRESDLALRSPSLATVHTAQDPLAIRQV